MEHEVITIHEEEENICNLNRKGKSLANDASCSQIQEMGKVSEVPSSSTSSSPSQDEYQVPEPTEIKSQEESEQDEAAVRNSLTLIERRLKERPRAAITHGKGRNFICVHLQVSS